MNPTTEPLHETIRRQVSDRRRWADVFNELGLVGRGVEVGVLRGDFSRTLLESWRGSKLYLVDSWRHHPGLVDVNNPGPEGHLHNMTVAFQQVYAHGGRAVLIREESRAAASLFPDGSLDFVYLDAAHDYASVTADLVSWRPKVRPGGLLCGDDYADGVWVSHGPDGTCLPTVIEVKRALTDYCARAGLEAGFADGGETHQWWILA
jgi:hypothetical protein